MTTQVPLGELASAAQGLNTSSTIASLSARSLEELTIPLPDSRHLHRPAGLIDESERAYSAAVEAAHQRRTAIRDHIISSNDETKLGSPANRDRIIRSLLNRAKPAERRGKVLFVDAAQEGRYRQGRARNYLDREHIDAMVRAYRDYQDVPRFAHVADVEEIERNDYNLSISRYVDTTEEEEPIDIGEALAKLRDAERRRDDAVARMDSMLAELGYAEG